jgi:hypothetical protein
MKLPCFASQFEFRASGRGFVQIVAVNRGADKIIETLHYTEQGRIVDSDPVDVENARRLNESAEALNSVLRDLAGCGEE